MEAPTSSARFGKLACDYLILLTREYFIRFPGQVAVDGCQVAMIDNLLVDRPELHPNSFINARELTTAAASPLVTKLPL